MNEMTPPSNAKLIWNCRRGMLELDILLSRFVTKQITILNDRQRYLFARLLDCADPDLFAYLMGQAVPDDQELMEIVTYIHAHDSV